VTNEVVRLTDQLLRGETAHIHKCVVGIDDMTLDIGGRQQGAALVKHIFLLGHGLVVSHRE